MTVVEVLLGASIGTLIVGGILTLVLLVGGEQRRTLADASLQHKIGATQDRILALLRSMSASESVIFGNPTTAPGGGTVYEKVIFAKGPAPDFPREQLAYDPDTKQLVHDPNLSVTGDEIVLVGGQAETQLAELYFYPSLKVGGVLDGSVLNVWMKFDDNGSAGRRNPDGTLKHTTVARSFAVSFRNL